MAKQSKDSGVMGAVKGGVSVLSDIFFGSIFPKLQEGTEELIDKVEKRALALQERLVQKIAASMVNALGIVFLLFALFYYLIEFKGMYRTHVFLILGAALLLIAFIMKYRMMANERR